MLPVGVTSNSVSSSKPQENLYNDSSQNDLNSSSWQSFSSLACDPPMYSLKCLTETVNSLSELSVSHISSGYNTLDEHPPSTEHKSSTKNEKSQRLSVASSTDSNNGIKVNSSDIPSDYVRIKSQSTGAGSMSQISSASRGTFFMISTLDGLSSSPDGQSESEPTSTSRHQSASLSQLRHITADSMEAYLDETLPPSGSLNLPHLEDGLSSAEEGEFVSDDENDDGSAFYPTKTNALVNGKNVGCESGLLSRKLMEDITQDIKEIKRAIVDDCDLPPVIPRTHSVSSPASTQPQDYIEKVTNEFAHFRNAFPLSSQDHHLSNCNVTETVSATQMVYNPNVVYLDPRQNARNQSTEQFQMHPIYSTSSSNSIQSSTTTSRPVMTSISNAPLSDPSSSSSSSQPPTHHSHPPPPSSNHNDKHSASTNNNNNNATTNVRRSNVVNQLGLPLRTAAHGPINPVYFQKEDSISPNSHVDSNAVWACSNHYPPNMIPGGNLHHFPVVNHRSCINNNIAATPTTTTTSTAATAPTTTTGTGTTSSSMASRHKPSSRKSNHAKSNVDEKPLEAQHWTFPNVSHTLYSSSSSGGEMDEDMDSGSEEHSGVDDESHIYQETFSHMPSSGTMQCNSVRCTNQMVPNMPISTDFMPSRDAASNVPMNHHATHFKPPGQSLHAVPKHPNGACSSNLSHERQYRQMDKPSSSQIPGVPASETIDYESDEDTAKLLNRPYQKEQSMDIPELREERELQSAKQRRGREVAVRHPERPSHLIEGALFRVMYLGSTQLFCDVQPSKATRLLQAQEAVGRIKVPENEFQPCTPVDLFVSTEKLIVLNTNLREIVMDYALRTISYIADIGDVLVLMARPTTLPSESETNDSTQGDNSDRRCDKVTNATSPVTTSSSDSGSGVEDGASQRHSTGMTSPKTVSQNKIVCHVFESAEAQMIAQCIGKAFQAAYIEFLRANGIDDPNMFKEMDYQEVLNQQELYGDELHMFANRDMQKEIVIPKHQGEPLGIVIVESGWGSMVPTVMLANMNSTGPAARCGQLNIGNQIISVNGNSVVGLPLSMCQQIIKNCRPLTAVKLSIVCSSPVVEVLIRRPDAKYQLGFSVQNGVICSLLRGGIAERGGIRVGHRIIEINGQSVVAVPHERIVHLLATAVGEIHLRTMPTSIFRLLTGQETPHHI